MFFRNNQNMYWGNRTNIIKGYYQFIFINYLCRNFFIYNLTKNTIFFLHIIYFGHSFSIIFTIRYAYSPIPYISFFIPYALYVSFILGF